MGNSVTPGVGNYVTDSALKLGNYVTGDTRRAHHTLRPLGDEAFAAI